MNRRGFLSGLVGAASSVVLPYEPQRIYSFGSEVGAFGMPIIERMLRLLAVQKQMGMSGARYIQERMRIESMVRRMLPPQQVPDQPGIPGYDRILHGRAIHLFSQRPRHEPQELPPWTCSDDSGPSRP